MTPLPLSGLGLAAGGGPLGQDTENVHCHHQVHWWTVPETVAEYNSVAVYCVQL